ncbi:hypothetical protein E4T47_01054 [Aureobasidium subglaciale]|nr:hypothetical protein E4T47_01054 [Aureobasidium subglaciale]
MAVRLAFDLGLHISTRRYVSEGSMSLQEANARNVAVWGCFMNDRWVMVPMATLVADCTSADRFMRTSKT